MTAITATQYIHIERSLGLVSSGARQFATKDDVFLVSNPIHHAPWHLLTKACQQNWERYAVGHNLVSEAV